MIEISQLLGLPSTKKGLKWERMAAVPSAAFTGWTKKVAKTSHKPASKIKTYGLPTSFTTLAEDFTSLHIYVSSINFFCPPSSSKDLYLIFVLGPEPMVLMD